MFPEVDVLGAFVPGVAVWCVVSLVMFVFADALLTKVGFFRFVWHPPLVRFSLFVILFCGLGLVMSNN
jgi:Protein of unknown function (DUF1656)